MLIDKIDKKKTKEANSFISLENKIFDMSSKQEDLIIEKSDIDMTSELGNPKYVSSTYGPARLSKLVTMDNSNPKLQSKLSTALVEKLYNDFSKIVPIKDLNDIFEKSEDILCSILKCEQVSFIMIDPKLIEIFEAEDRGFVTHILIDHCPMVIAHQNTQYYQRIKINRDNMINLKDEENYGNLDI